jgi:tetratricopeptide (TPR) repeat protein
MALPEQARWRAARWLPGAVFVLALAVRLAYNFEIRNLPTLHELVMDAQRYDALARDILDHGWRPREAFYQAPLYPYLLAAVYAASGRSATAMRLAQALAGALTAALAAIAAGRLWEPAPGDEPGDRDRRQATAGVAVAGVLAALYAPAVFYTPLLLKTVPTLLCESAALVLLLPPAGRAVSPLRGLAAGLALGGAALLQESLLLLAPAAALYLLDAGRLADPGQAAAHGRRRAWQSRWAPAGGAVALLAGAALALAPAALLNYAAGGQVLLTSSQGGMNFYIGNARGATGTYAALSSGSQIPERQRADAERLAAGFAARERGRPVAAGQLTPAEVSSLFWRETGREIAADPGAWLRLMRRKIRLFWNAYELPDAEGFRVYRRESVVLRSDPVVFGTVAPLAALGLLALARGGPRQRRGALLLALLAGAACVSVVLFFVFGRYRLAVVPFLLPLAAAGALELIDVATRARAASWRGAARPALDLALLAGAGLAVTLPCYSAAEVRQQDSAIEYNLGVAATRWSESTHAEHLRLAAAAREHPGDPGPRQARAAAARESLVQAVRQASRAAAYLEEATQSSPGFFAAEVEWAIARERRGSFLAEAGEYAQALGDYFAARRRLAGALTAMTSGSSGSAATFAGAGTPGRRQGADPELESEAHTVLAALDAGAAGALNNLGVELIAAGQLERAQSALSQAVALAPGQPAPRGSLALCWFQRGLAARAALGRGAAAAAQLFAASRDGYRQAIQLADAAGRADLAGLYRRGLAAADAELTRDRGGS